MSGKFEEIMAASKLSELLQKKDEDHTKKVIVWVLAIIGAVAAVKKSSSNFLTIFYPYEVSFLCTRHGSACI